MPILALIAGAIIGTGARIGLDALIPHTDTQFPVSTLLINVVGSFALGLLVARVWPVAPAWLRTGLGTGLLGSFTTFSAFALSLVTLTRAGLGGVGLLYLIASIVAGFGAAALGLRLGRRRVAPPIEADE
jgi:CrcB protein